MHLKLLLKDEAVRQVTHEMTTCGTVPARLGWNYRMNELVAAVGRVQLTRAKAYAQMLALAGIPGEAQVGFGRDLQQASPFRLTRGVGNVGRSCAYLFRPEARARGGYEVDPMMWALTGDGALKIILDAQGECLMRMHER